MDEWVGKGMTSLKQRPLLILKGAGCTFYFGFEVWIFVEHCHLFLPVKFIPPVGDYFLKICGIEAILEARVLQRLSIASPVDALMKVLLKKTIHITVLFAVTICWRWH